MRLMDGLACRVRVHGPRVTVVQQRTRCGRMVADPADMGPEATPKDASVSSDDRSIREATSRSNASLSACHHQLANGYRSSLLRCRRTDARKAPAEAEPASGRPGGSRH